MNEEICKAMTQSIIEGDAEKAVDLAKMAIENKLDPLTAISCGFVPGLNLIGERFGRGDAFLPELVMSGEAMKAAVAALGPEMERQGSKIEILGRVVLATVEGDIHEIGKTLVGTMLGASGFEVHDLGVNVTSDKIIKEALKLNADIIGLSALLTTTMVRQREIIDELDKEGLRPRIKVLIGGAPITRDWFETIKADGYSEDAIGAVEAARRMIGLNAN